MTDEAKKEEVKEEQLTEPAGDGPEQPQPISVKQIFDAYPNDKEKAMAYLLMGIQNDLNRIANALDYFASKDVAAEKAKQITPK